MEPVAQVTPKKSRRLLWIAIAVVIVIVVVGGIVAAFMIGKPTEKVTSSPSPSPEAKVATKEEVQQNLQVLDESLKQADQDQATAKSAIQDAKQQVKLSE